MARDTVASHPRRFAERSQGLFPGRREGPVRRWRIQCVSVIRRGSLAGGGKIQKPPVGGDAATRQLNDRFRPKTGRQFPRQPMLEFGTG